MVNSHSCTEGCFSARNSDKLTIKCFLCDKAFNAKCFDISMQPTVKLLSSGGNAMFMCHKCIDRVSKMKQSTRRSNDANRSAIPLNVNEANVNQQIVINDEGRVTLESMMAILNQINENYAKLSESNLESEVKIANQKLTDMQAKMDHQWISNKTAEHKTSSLLIQGMKDLQDKINLPSSHTMKVSSKINGNRTPAFKVIKNGNASTTDPLDWSFSFGQSALPNDNVELYQLLNGFEQNTWTSLDFLRHKQTDNTDALTRIETICNDLKTQIGQHRMGSPLTHSIELDNMQIIQDKCESIEKNIRELQSTINQISSKTSPTINNSAEHIVRASDKTDDQPNSSVNISDIRRIATQQAVDQLTVNSPVSQPILNLVSKEQETLDQEIYISKLPISTTCDEIAEYISHKMSISSNNLKIHRLTKKNQDLTKLSFVSFLIETNKLIANRLIRQEFWPNLVGVKWWKRKGEQTSSLNVNANYFLPIAKAHNPQR